MTEYECLLTKANPLANKEGDDVRVLHKLSLVAQVPEPVYKNYFLQIFLQNSAMFGNEKSKVGLKKIVFPLGVEFLWVRKHLWVVHDLKGLKKHKCHNTLQIQTKNNVMSIIWRIHGLKILTLYGLILFNSNMFISVFLQNKSGMTPHWRYSSVPKNALSSAMDLNFDTFFPTISFQG
jgi:hypothetical protein